MQALLTVALATLLATAGRAQPPAAAPAAIDVATSRVWTFVDKAGLVGHVHAIEGRLTSGWIALGARERAGEIQFDMRSFRADTPDARRALRLDGQIDASTQQQTNANMLGPEVLDVGRHPTAGFEIQSALPAATRPGGPPAYELVGVFTLKGVRRPLTVRAELEDAGSAIVLRGVFPIRQTAFGMKPYAKFGGVVGVADELRIHGDLRIPKAAAAAPPAAPVVGPTALQPASPPR